jgi:LmbE family N-acetylglucosaminyl deacetylase
LDAEDSKPQNEKNESVKGILAVVSHPDDETFGCGGTLALHAATGGDARVLCITCNPRERRKEIVDACRELGISDPHVLDEDEVNNSRLMVKFVADFIVTEKPRIVITHLPYDYHVDHRATYNLVKEAIEWGAHTTTYKEPLLVERLLLMEINTLIPNPGVIVDVSKIADKKKAAIACYPTQLAKFPWHYYEDWNLKKAELRGIQSNCSYAEAFQEEALPRNGPFYKEKATKKL